MNRSGLPWCILYSQKLTPSEKLVFMTLKDRAYQQDKTCESGFYCYIDWLCANLNMSENTVRKALNGLREKKIINSKRVKVHKNVVNMWFIDWSIIDKVSKQFRFKDNECTEIDVLEEVVETPIEQIPDVLPTDVEEFNDNDFRFGEIDVTDPMLSFLIEDEETFDDKIKRYIPYLKEVEYGSNEFYNRMRNVIADFPTGEKKYADQEIKRILAA